MKLFSKKEKHHQLKCVKARTEKSKKSFFNQVHATGLFLYPLKTENQRFSDVFRGNRKRAMKWVNKKIRRIFKKFFEKPSPCSLKS